MGQHLLLYDGVCGLCDRLVQFVLKRDRNDKFRFAALQSRFAHEYLPKHGKDPAVLDTVYLVLNYGADAEKLLSKGKAALTVCKEIGGGWSLLYIFAVLPSFILDLFYNLVAGNRYRIFGKANACRIPSAHERAKFIEV
jgi:predicted DCC family thiol-disulfide oxidoreductase YuxK